MPNVNFLFVLKDKMSAGLNAIDGNLQKLDGRLKGVTTRLEHFKKKTENIGKLANKVTDIGKGLSVGVTLPVIAMGGAMVKAAADIEAMQQQLETMTGSAEAGGKMFNEIKTMAAKTPFETKDLMKATNTMLGFGIAQDKVLPLMNQLGDISGGNADRFQSLALAFSQVSSAGKLQGQDLNQMINAGFNPLENIAKRTGKSVGYWKEQMSKGKVTVKMVEQAMRDATSEGGRFYKMMEKQSKTALGQWSTFQDNLNMVLAEFGKIILPIAIDALAKLSETLEWINSLSPETKKLVLIVAAFAAGLGPLLIILGSVTSAVLSLNAGLGTLAVMLKMTKLATLGWGAGWIAGIWGLIKGIQLLIELLKNLKSRLAAIDGRKIGNINLDNQQNLDYLSGEYARIGAKAFKKKYNKETVKAVEQNNKNIANTNNTTNNTTNNNYYAGANPRNAQYAT